MKKSISFILMFLFILIMTSCSISESIYEEIATYVSNNVEELESNIDENTENTFYTYKTQWYGVYYGYYYSSSGDITTPDFYGNSIGISEEDDGGYYLGKPNNGTDWCFVKHIDGNWYYYELHWDAP